ncbi:O-antigen ligase family protein [Microbacterium sp. CFH 90308]|uniref:O-antigen ligase family protein n=1 Tax=Microbacterium salsuginis TaxID=2722803 RepID=A0ABX1KCX0_9MICO|nr:O-antigen ligase family protein [Microbacterium sp. CFH 90308]NLP83904.1 O-antigen ligase family protein [Microbacterium sp. CFH 90308]
MAVYSKHPASAPPTPPVREKTGHLLLRGWCIFVLFMSLSGVAWVHTFGTPVAAAITIGAGVLSVVLWIILRPPVQWRRLPWFAAAYVVWATLSILWSAWPGTTAITLLLLYLTTIQALFIGTVLTWRELVRAVASALKWVMALSLLFELAVSVFVQAPMLPGFVVGEADDPIEYWSRNNLFDWPERLQGIMGNANLLGPVALLAIVVFGIRIAAGAPRRVLLYAWIVLSAFLFLRASSATAYLAAAAVAVVLATVLLMRRARRPGERTKYYIAYAVVGVGGLLGLWLLRDTIFSALGRSSDLTGREAIWEAVLGRTAERPWVGWGFATPWAPWDPAFDRWVVDHGQTVMQAHNMWIDVSMQLGIIGVVLMATVYFAFVWRSWFFAVDRPRWDLKADRPYSSLTLLPTLVGAILLVQGLAESTPLLLWGWLFVVMLGAKIKQSPHVGVGPAEQSAAIERGERSPALDEPYPPVERTHPPVVERAQRDETPSKRAT